MAITDTLDVDSLVHGECDPRFAAVRAALDENLARRNEIGSAVCVYHQGEKVVDLWGGHLDSTRTRPWRADAAAHGDMYDRDSRIRANLGIAPRPGFA